MSITYHSSFMEMKDYIKNHKDKIPNTSTTPRSKKEAWDIINTYIGTRQTSSEITNDDHLISYLLQNFSNEQYGYQHKSSIIFDDDDEYHIFNALPKKNISKYIIQNTLNVQF